MTSIEVEDSIDPGKQHDILEYQFYKQTLAELQKKQEQLESQVTLLFEANTSLRQAAQRATQYKCPN